MNVRKNRLQIFVLVIMFMFLLMGVPSVTDASDVETMVNEEYMSYCEDIGSQYGISSCLLMAMCYTESNNNPYAYSDFGAEGLCQVVRRYQTDRMERLGVTDLYDPYSNILMCADILSEYESKGYEIGDSLIAYNCGENSATFKKYHDSGMLTKYAETILKREEVISEWKYGN